MLSLANLVPSRHTATINVPEISAVILNDTTRERHHGCSRVMANLYQVLDEHKINVTGIGYLNDDLQHPGLLEQIDSCDLALVNGEGTIHDGNTYAESLLRLVSNSKAKTKVLLNSTYQSNPPHYREYLENFDHIYVRDQHSKRELSGIGIASHVVPDLTFLSHHAADEPVDSRILINCSVDRETMVHLHWLGKRLGKKAHPVSIFEKNQNFAQRWMEIRRSLAISDMRSPKAMYRIAAARHWFGRNAFNTHQDFSSKLAQSAFIVSGRYHAICMAIENRTPFLAIESNTFKIRALLEEVGLEGRSINKSDFLAGVDAEFRPFNSYERNLIDDFDDCAKKSIRNMFTQIIKHD